MMAMNAAAKECGVCNEEFDEESRCPRIFHCFHTLCAACIDQLILKRAKYCPFCRREFSASSARDVAINHTVLELIEYIRLQESPSKGGPLKDHISDLKMTRNRLLITCQETETKIEENLRGVNALKNYITQLNVQIKNNLMLKIEKMFSQNVKALKELNAKSTTLENRLKEIKGKMFYFSNLDGKLVNACASDAFQEIDIPLEKSELINDVIDKWIYNFQEIISKEEESLLKTKEDVKRRKEKINIMLEVLNSREEVEVDPVTSVMPAIHEASLPEEMTIDVLREKSYPVNRLLREGKIFAIHEQEGRRRSAMLSITEDDMLCLHHLKDEPLPLDSHHIQHQDVMTLLDSSSKLTFLELGAEGSTLGRLYIRLTPNMETAQHFSLQCTGEIEPSYANTNILGVWNNGCDGEFVIGGNCTLNGGIGGQARMGNEERGGFGRPLLAGTVGVWWGWKEALATKFCIQTRDCPGQMTSKSFGMVERGLEVLTDAITRYPSISGLSIQDCGIVLPR